MGKASEYSAAVSEFKNRINEIRAGKNDTIKSNWESLKKRR